MKVNFVDLKRQYLPMIGELMKSVDDVIDTTSFVGGKYLTEFEEKFAAYHGAKYCVGVGSGTDALWLALKAYGIGDGDEVIVPANTFIATAFAASQLRAKVVFIDADPNTYNMDLKALRKLVTDKTRAIMPVHLYGNPCNVEEIKKIVGSRNVIIVEDCAQSIGAHINGVKRGTVGNIGCYSFYPAKNLGGLGQGGAVITDDPEVAKLIREYGNVGRIEGSHFDYGHIGFNSRLDTINAAFLSVGMNYIDEWNRSRRQVAAWYSKYLSVVEEVRLPYSEPGYYAVHHLFPVQCGSKELRDGLKNFLTENGIGTGLHYPVPCHKQDPYLTKKKFKVAERLADTLVSLPMHPSLREEEVRIVCEKVKEYYNGDKINS